MEYKATHPLSLRRSEGRVFWTFLSAVLLLIWATFVNNAGGWSNVVQSLSASYVAGVAFWFLCVWSTERKERRIIQNHLREYYVLLKRSLIAEVLASLSGSYDPKSKEVEGLMSPARFREFAFTKQLDGKSNWDAVLSDWEVNSTRLNDVRVHLLSFAKSVELVMTRLDFTNENAFRELWYCCHRIRAVLSLSMFNQGTPAKYIGNQLVFPRLAALDSAEGDIGNGVDWIETAINNIYTPMERVFPLGVRALRWFDYITDGLLQKLKQKDITT